MQKLKRLKLCIGDGAGSWFDIHSKAPVVAIQKTLSMYGVNASEMDIRRDMGLPKRQHFQGLLKMDHLAKQFPQYDSHRDLEEILETYKSQQVDVLAKNKEFTRLVDGAPEFIEFLKSQNIKIGLTSGYNRTVMDVILNSLASQGFMPDVSVSSTECNSRRDMNLHCLDSFNFAKSEALAFGDTKFDFEGAYLAGISFCGIEHQFCSKLDFDEFGCSKTVPKILDLKEFF